MTEYFDNQNINIHLPVNKAHTISFQTLGCKVNRYESDAVRQAFEDLGFKVVSDADDADVFIINTCTVTAEADRKSRQMIRRARRRNPNAVVVAMGCQVELLKSASEADISVGTKNRLSVVDKVLEKIGDSLVHQSEIFTEGAYQEFGSVLSQEDTRAYIKIEDGCDSFCSYCIIPFARGRVVSRAPDDILREAADLGNRGFHEIVLTGIHICSYGKDRGEGIGALESLLSALDQIPSIHRIRLGSLEPNSLTPSFIRSLSDLKKLCPHFHISLQSGSDSVLARMNRKYDTQVYRSVISQIRAFFSDAAITTDVITAFPAETQKEHEETLRFCCEMRFSRIHVFPFSVRKGTKAADMSPQVSAQTAAVRRDDLLALSQELSAVFSKSFIGRYVEVLLETRDEDGTFTGYTKEYVRIHIAAHEGLIQGQVAEVLVQSAADDELFGGIVQESTR